MHRSAVGAHDAVAHRQRRDQLRKRLGRPRQYWNVDAALRNRPSPAVIAGMPWIVRLARRPEQQKSHGVPTCDPADQRREAFRGPALVLPPRTDVHSDDRGLAPQTGESSLDVAALAGIGENPRGGRRTLDAERSEQVEDLLHFVHPRFAIVGQGDVEAGMSLAVLGIAKYMPCADQPCEPQRARDKPRGGEDGVVKLFLSQGDDQPKAIGIDRNDRTRLAAVLSLFVGVDGVHVGIPGEDGLVICIHQRRDVSARIAFAQRRDERRGADQIADIIAADDQYTRAPFRRCRCRGYENAHQGATILPGPVPASVLIRTLRRSMKASSENRNKCTRADSLSKRNSPSSTRFSAFSKPAPPSSRGSR